MHALFALLLLGSVARSPAHYYIGNDPAQWRTGVLEAQSATEGPDASIVFSRYAGDQNPTTLARIAVDAAGNTYAVGSRQIPATDYAELLTDVMVTKVDPAGNLVYTTYLGGKGTDKGLGIAADAAGNAWVVGSTTSANFPLRNAPYPRQSAGFIAKLNPDGLLVYSTYFGGAVDSGITYDGAVNAVAVDSAGAVYVTGETRETGFPTTAGAFQTTVAGCPNLAPCTTAFVAKLSSAGAVVYSTFLRSSGAGYCVGGGTCTAYLEAYDRGLAIAVDGSGNVYVAGLTNKPQLPPTPAGFQTTSPGIAPFVAKLSADGSALRYASFLGGIVYGYSPLWFSGDQPAAIAVDGSGSAYVVGKTANPSFPVTGGALQTAFGGPLTSAGSSAVAPGDAFVAKINPAGTALVYSTYLGGSGADQANGIALDSQGNAYVSGVTASPEFARGDLTLPAGSGFLVKLNPAGSAISYAARFPNGAAGQDVALDASGRIHLGGASALVSALDVAATPGPAILAAGNLAAQDVSGRVAPLELISIWGQAFGPATPASSADAPTTLSETQVLFDGVAVPLLYVSDQQIKAIAPASLSQLTTRVKVTYRGTATAEFPLYVVSLLPDVFKNADGTAAALNQDGTLNSAAQPAKGGSIVAIWGTGASDASQVQVLVGGSRANILYAGPAPGMVSGVFQLNFRVPTGLTAGAVTIRLAPAVLSSVTEASGLVGAGSAQLYVTP